MKHIVAITQPSELDKVREALIEVGVMGMTVVEVRGFGRQRGHAEISRAREYDVEFLPKLRIEIAVTNPMLEEVLSVLRNAANTGKGGAGKILVEDLEEVVRIRTGEVNSDAL